MHHSRSHFFFNNYASVVRLSMKLRERNKMALKQWRRRFSNVKLISYMWCGSAVHSHTHVYQVVRRISFLDATILMVNLLWILRWTGGRGALDDEIERIIILDNNNNKFDDILSNLQLNDNDDTRSNNNNFSLCIEFFFSVFSFAFKIKMAYIFHQTKHRHSINYCKKCGYLVRLSLSNTIQNHKIVGKDFIVFSFVSLFFCW